MLEQDGIMELGIWLYIELNWCCVLNWMNRFGCGFGWMAWDEKCVCFWSNILKI